MKIVHYLPKDKFPVKGYGGTQRIAYWLGKAQAEMGHCVTFMCAEGSHVPFAKVVTAPKQPFDDLTPFIPSQTDIVQLYNTPDFKLDFPFLVRIRGNGKASETYHRNTIFLSKKHAENHNWTEYVHNGLDISEYNMQAKKENFLLFLAKASWVVKNLSGSVKVANEAGVPIHIAGGKAPFWISDAVSHGTVDGQIKADLLRSARALLFPIIWDEPFGIVAIEALACGTPVIATQRGALPEILTSECGVIADSFDSLVAAVEAVGSIEPERCRERVVENFTHIRMAENYLTYYERVIKTGYLRKGNPVALKRPRSIILYKQPFHHYAENFLTALYVKEYFK